MSLCSSQHPDLDPARSPIHDIHIYVCSPGRRRRHHGPIGPRRTPEKSKQFHRPWRNPGPAEAHPLSLDHYRPSAHVESVAPPIFPGPAFLFLAVRWPLPLLPAHLLSGRHRAFRYPPARTRRKSFHGGSLSVATLRSCFAAHRPHRPCRGVRRMRLTHASRRSFAAPSEGPVNRAGHRKKFAQSGVHFGSARAVLEVFPKTVTPRGESHCDERTDRESGLVRSEAWVSRTRRTPAPGRAGRYACGAGTAQQSGAASRGVRAHRGESHATNAGTWRYRLVLSGAG